MKFKVVMALSLAVLMVGTMATPALAKPAKSNLYSVDPGGEYPLGDRSTTSIRATHDNHLAVTVVLKGVTPGAEYGVFAYDRVSVSPDEYVPHLVGYYTTDAKGNGRFKGVTAAAFSNNHTFKVWVSRDGLDVFHSINLQVDFR